MKKAVIYSRFSPRPNADQCVSCDTQDHYCLKYCDLHDLEVIGVYRDENASGRSQDKRPGLATAMAMACRERAILVCYAIARWARSTVDAHLMLQRLKDAGGHFASVSESLSTDSPVGKFVFTIIAAAAEMEREQTAERTSTALRYYQEQGVRVSHALPYGMEEDPESEVAECGLRTKLRPCPREIRIIEEIRRMRDSGMSLRGIARELNGRGVGARGAQWRHPLIKRILAREGSLGDE